MRSLKILLLSSCCVFFAINCFALRVGDMAPDFKATSTAGDITLSALTQQGPVVLAFYYADFTPV